MTLDYHQFVFLCEGSSDKGLKEILESILIETGFDEVYGEVFVWPGSIADQLAQFCQRSLYADTIFVHRDADGAGRDTRVAEIQSAAAAMEWPNDHTPVVVPIVPQRMTEAWLLLDETAIRNVCGAPRSRAQLHLPRRRDVEEVANPKEVLFQALRDAYLDGSVSRVTTQQLSDWRARLLARLDIHGPVTSLSAWQFMLSDVSEVWTRYRDQRE